MRHLFFRVFFAMNHSVKRTRLLIDGAWIRPEELDVNVKSVLDYGIKDGQVVYVCFLRFGPLSASPYFQLIRRYDGGGHFKFLVRHSVQTSRLKEEQT